MSLRGQSEGIVMRRHNEIDPRHWPSYSALSAGRIDARGAPRRNPARHQRDDNQNDDDDGVGRGSRRDVSKSSVTSPRLASAPPDRPMTAPIAVSESP